jgi:hypothetical protein
MEGAMGATHETDAVAEHGLRTLESLVAEGDLAMAAIMFEMIGENVEQCCDDIQARRLQEIAAALGVDTPGSNVVPFRH